MPARHMQLLILALLLTTTLGLTTATRARPAEPPAAALTQSNTTFLPLVRALGQAPAPVAGEPWSEPATWGGRLPQAGEAVNIPAGKHVLLDISPPALASLSIDGILSFDNRDLELTAGYIMLHGALRIGSTEAPFTNHATITLTGADPEQSVMGMGTRGILVMGGSLELYGSPPAIPWTKLNANAASGSSQLTLAEAVDWQPGDRIAVAPTGFYREGETETFGLDGVQGDQLSLDGQLATSRWGQLQYVSANGMALAPDPSFVPPTANTPTVLDERAEVANLSRNILIRAADDALWQEQGFGAHLMAMSGAKLALDGVAFQRAGQAGRMGRYPIHFHLLSYHTDGSEIGDSDSFVQHSVIDGSRNRCITLHGSNGLELRDNICHDIRGHAIFFEDAVERRNVVEGNLTLKVRSPAAADRLQIHDGNIFQGGSSGYWITNPDNIIRNNTAADSEGNGFWLSYPEQALGALKAVAITPDNIPLGVFYGNTAHSNRELGFNLDWVVTDDAGNVKPHKYTPFPNGIDDGGYTNRLRFTLEQITTYKNNQGGFWNRVSLPDYIGWISADNGGTFFAGAGDNGWLRESLIVGTSLNATTYPLNEPPVAVASYHSTFDISENLIVEFPFVAGEASGAFKTDDYYIRAVDKGLVRNPNNRLINSSPGYRMLPKLEENWTLAGALWDAHGYWGPSGNYWVYDNPFLTHGATCTPVAPAGQNGMSCDGEYYGVGMFMTDYQTSRFSPLIPITATRYDSAGQAVGEWTVGDGNLAPKLGNMRHFATTTGGTYSLSFPGQPLPKEVALSISNAYRAEDWFTLGTDFDASVPPAGVYLTTWYHYSQVAAWTDDSLNANRRVVVSQVGSRAELEAATAAAYWLDSANNRLWVKVYGGIYSPEASDPNSDEALYKPIYLWVAPGN